jgi:chromosome segregation ATPase
MPTDTLSHFREEARRLRGPESKKRRRELLENIRTDAVAMIALASDISIPSENRKPLEQLVKDVQSTAEELRASAEHLIVAALDHADSVVRLWEEIWEAALQRSTLDLTEEVQNLKGAFENANESLQETLLLTKEDNIRFERPLARLDELEARVADFPLWVRECVARWEMLGKPVPPLDRDRVARAQSAYARGEHEALDEVLSRVEAGGLWVKE